MQNFVAVMENIKNLEKAGSKRKNLIDDTLCYRLFGKPVAATNKRRKMLTSTPVTSARQQEVAKGGQTGTHRQQANVSTETALTARQTLERVLSGQSVRINI